MRGSGIGLALADEIITLHNGTLEVESQENLGTAVTIRIPAMQQFDNKDMQEVQQELPIELQEQHITDTETMDTSDMDQNQSNSCLLYTSTKAIERLVTGGTGNLYVLCNYTALYNTHLILKKLEEGKV